MLLDVLVAGFEILVKGQLSLTIAELTWSAHPTVDFFFIYGCGIALALGVLLRGEWISVFEIFDLILCLQRILQALKRLRLIGLVKVAATDEHSRTSLIYHHERACLVKCAVNVRAHDTAAI